MADVVEVRPQHMPKAQADAIAGRGTIEGARVLDWWKRQSTALQNAFADSVRTSMANGETLQQAITRVVGGTINGVKVAGVMDTSRGRAGALVATSMNNATNRARLATYQQNTDLIKEIQQISTLDNRTSEICIAYAGATWDAETLEPTGDNELPFNGGPPRHFNCRSTIVPITKSFKELGINLDEAPKGERASMDGTVPEDISFNDWLRTKDTGFQNDLLGVRKAELWRGNKITLQQLVNFHGDPLSVDELEALASKPKPAPKADAKIERKYNWAPNPLASEVETIAFNKPLQEAYKQSVAEMEDVLAKDKTGALRRGLYRYTGASYSSINDALRTGNPMDSGDKKVYDQLQELAQAMPPIKDDVVVYRGIEGSLPGTDRLAPGDTYKMQGFVSSSQMPRVANQFLHRYTDAQQNATLFEIAVPKGAEGVLRGFNAYETEFLFNHGSKFRVLSVRTQVLPDFKQTIRVVRLEYKGA